MNTCNNDNCDKQLYINNLCKNCFRESIGIITKRPRIHKKEKSKCASLGCNNNVHAKGLCAHHYNKKRQEAHSEIRNTKNINLKITELKYKGDISDGSHTFDELYYHRMILFSIICNANKLRAWKSKLHDDGTMFDDYFIVGITIENVGDYTYHYHIDHWDKFDVKELEKAPEWDGHTAADIDRLLLL